MQVREFAARILHGATLQEKLAPAPPRLRDDEPGPATRPRAPARAPSLAILPARQVKVPSLPGMLDRHQRPRILHALANHELQAVELFAWALLAFPAAPRAFRRGLLRILGDEQRHAEAYCRRLADFGVAFGDWGVSGYFWNKVQKLAHPVEFVCAMSLTFEN
ncbi:MAG: ferritin-like domain-containing protein, partial [Actinobacteria bacterium]|nr:ferritin-like domain-containing protein [Actinomycetota bacterium]